MLSEPIFSRDANGKIRVWRGEAEGGRWRAITGIDGGAMVTSEWAATPARSRPTDEEQAVFEMNAQRNKLLGKDYRINRESVDIPRGSWIKPMLANKYPGYPGRCYIQPKLDGMRCLANIDGLWSRGNKPIVAAPHIVLACARSLFVKFPHIVFDGELYNHDMHDDFNGLMSIARKTQPSAADLLDSALKLQYHIYDCYFVDAPDMPFSQRNNFLQLRLGEVEKIEEPCLKLVRTVHCGSQGLLDNMHMDFIQEGYEGSIVRLDRAYEQKRSPTLLKRKDFIDGEFELLRIEEGQGNWSGYAKRAVCKTNEGVEFGAGIKGSQEFCLALLNDPVSKYQSVTIRHFGMTPDGSVRFPIAVSFNEKGSLEPRKPIDSESTEEEF